MTDATDEPVYRAIKERVVDFDFAQGERIYIESIAAQLGVSTWQVRRVFDHLAVEGLVVRAPKKGFYALTLNEDDLIEHYQITRHILQLGLETLKPETVQTMPDYAPVGGLVAKLNQPSATDVDFLANFTGKVFANIIKITKRSPLVTAISRENDHLRYVRTLECQRFEDVQRELSCFCDLFLAAEREELVLAIRDYHSRRLEILPELLKFLRH